MIQMVRGYAPPPQDAGMDYAGYGVAARERPMPSAHAQGLMRAIPALNGYSGCGCGSQRLAGYGSPVLRNQPADPTVITDSWGIDFTDPAKKSGAGVVAGVVVAAALAKWAGLW